MTLKVISKARLWGPCLPADAPDLVEDTLNGHDTLDVLRRFAIGEVDRDQMGYMIERIFEANELRRLEKSCESDLEYEEHA